MGPWIVTLERDPDLQPWEIERIEIIAGQTLAGAADLIAHRAGTELGRTLTFRISDDRRRRPHRPVASDRRRYAAAV